MMSSFRQYAGEAALEQLNQRSSTNQLRRLALSWDAGMDSFDVVMERRTLNKLVPILRNGVTSPT